MPCTVLPSFGRLFEMCKNREYAETVHSSATGDEERVPTAQRILGRIRTVRRDYMLTRCYNVMDRIVRQMRRHGMFRTTIDVAIDKHLVCRYDKFERTVNTIKSKYKRGACNFNYLATVNCIVDGSRAFLGSKLFLRGHSNSQTILELVEGCKRKGIKIRSLKIDLEFFTVQIINMLDTQNIAFTVPAIKTLGVKEAINEFKEGRRDTVSRHSIRSADGSTANFALIIFDKGEGKFFTFATNTPVAEVLAYNSGAMKGAEGFAEQYRSRWRGDSIQGLRIGKAKNHEQERVCTNPAAVRADVHVQRVVPGKVPCTGIISYCVHDAQGVAQAVPQVHTGSRPDGISYLTCSLRRTGRDQGQPKGCWRT